MSGGGVGAEQQRIGEVTGVAQKASSAGAHGKRCESGGGGVTRKKEALLDEPPGNGGSNNGPSPGTGKKRVRRHHNHKKQGSRKRIRRNTQSAPNNTNEFLMKEHDHLFHLDLNVDDYDLANSQAGALGLGAAVAVNEHRSLNHPPYISSEEEEDAFLDQEFSAMYDVVHQERLSVMTKPELINEYQLLEERVELLERKLKSEIRSKPDLLSPMPPPQPQMTLSIDLLSDDEKVRLVQEEVTLLREENEKLRADNIFLRKLFNSPIPNHVVMRGGQFDEEGDDRVSTDSGGGSGSGCESVTTDDRDMDKMIKRL